MVPGLFEEQYRAARERAAIIDRSGRGRIVVSGRDRATYLQGLLTNEIASLQPGQGCYAAYLTPQGRMIADVWVYELGDVILMTMIGDVKDVVLAKLDQFIFSEDVKLGDVTETFAQHAIVGPASAAVVAAVVGGTSADALSSLAEHGNLRAMFGDAPAIVTRVTDTGEPGFDLFVERPHADRLTTSFHDAGVIALGAAASDAIRIEAGVPLFHRDMDEATIPLEAGIESRAISFSKGCYVGQEVIIRVLHRGHGRVARKLVGLTLDAAAVPPAEAVVRAGDRDVGHVTSAAMSPALAKPIALGYVQRDFMQPGTAVTVDLAPATVTALPFVGRPR